MYRQYHWQFGIQKLHTYLEGFIPGKPCVLHAWPAGTGLVNQASEMLVGRHCMH
jgi:hypothetical protein